MCISAAALAAFLSLLDPKIVTAAPDRYIVHAQTQDVIWSRVVDEWCTGARLVGFGRAL